MNAEVKRRIVMSLVSLALAFGLLATYYIVTVPWNRTAVGQALTAGAFLGIAALVMQFMPVRAPMPVAAAEQKPEQVPVPHRSWQPEPDFEAEDFQADLASTPAATAELAPPSIVSMAPAASAAVVAASVASPFQAVPAAEPEPIIALPKAPEPIVASPLPPEPTTAPAPEPVSVPVPEPTSAPAPILAEPSPSLMTSEGLERVIEAADNEAAAGVLSLDEIKDGVEVLMVRNDHVRVDELQLPTIPAITIQPYRAEPARQTPSQPVVAPVPAAKKPVAALAPRPAMSRQSPKTEWREPDPETPKELLRELAEYWHVKYETERKRHNDILSQYEDVVRRLENLETAAALGATNAPRAHIVDENELPLDDMTVADAAAHEGKNELEDRWDRRTAQMERFH